MRTTFFALLSLLVAAAAFQPLCRLPVTRAVHVRSTQEETETEEPAFFEKKAASKGRLGSSIDQDGKSNVWAVEPKMQVEVAAEGDGTKKLIFIGGGAAATIAFITAVVSFLPDPDTI